MIYPLQDVTHGNIKMQNKITQKWIVLWIENQLIMIPDAGHHLWFAVDKKESERRSERLPTLHCDCVSYNMAEFSFASRVLTVFLCDIFTGLES